MSFARTLLLRIGVVALLGSMTTAVVVSMGYVDSAVQRVQGRIDRVIQHAHETDLFAACDLDPAGWQHVDPIGIRYAYRDSATVSPGSYMPAWILARLRRTVERPGRPCDTIVAAWIPDDQLLLDGRRMTARATLLGLTASMALALVWVGWPLRRRIRRLRFRAARVGQLDFPSDDDRGRDEISEVDSALARAHRRIIADGKVLRRRSETIQDFLMDFAHDSRTPLTALGMLLEELATECSESQAPLVREALGQVVYMRSLADNMRLWARLNEGWNPATNGAPAIDLADVAERAAARARVIGRHVGVAIETNFESCRTDLGVDATLIEQAISNLLDNALIHATGVRNIEISLTNVGGGFRLTVTDDGKGLDPDARALLDGDWPPQRSQSKGSGLGLAIVERACREAGWRCSYLPRQPHGLQVALSDLP